MSRWVLLSAPSLVFGLAVARAQEPATPPPPIDSARVVRSGEDTLEELFLTGVFQSLPLQASQARRLLPVLEQAQTRLRELDEGEAAAVARLKAAVDAARRRAVTGQTTPDRGEQQLASTLDYWSSRREKVKDELVVLIRGTLARILSQQQLASLEERAQAAREADRRARFREAGMALRGGFGGEPVSRITINPNREEGAAAGPARIMIEAGPGGGGSNLGDTIRRMPEETYSRLRANLTAPPPSGAGGPDAGTGVARRGNMVRLFDQIRSLSDEQYARERANLGRQLQSQIGSGNAGGEEPDLQMNEFIRRHLLHPTALVVLRGVR